MKIHSCDFLIVGASVAGVTLATRLKALGYRVVVVEKESAPRTHFKGEYIQPLACNELRDAGLGAVIESANFINVLRFRDLTDSNKKLLSSGQIHYPDGQAAAAISYLDISRALRSTLRERIGQDFFEGASLSQMPNGCYAISSKGQAQQTTVCPRIVVGCDGRNSLVRKWMQGNPTLKQAHSVLGAPNELIVGCEVANTLDAHQEYEVIRTDGQGTLSVFALDKDRCRLYWSTSQKVSSQSAGLSPKAAWRERLQMLFDQISNSCELSLAGDLNPVAMPAYTHWYGPAQKGNVFLAGDALAVTTPFGGQGMSCATLHARFLAEAFSQGIPAGDAHIDSIGSQYEVQCRKLFAHFNLINTGLYHLFFSRARLSKTATKYMLTHWESDPNIINRLGRIFGGLDLDTPETPELLQLFGLKGLRALAQKSQLISRLPIHQGLPPAMRLSLSAKKFVSKFIPITD